MIAHDPNAQCHPMSRKFLCAGGKLRAELERFVGGTQLHTGLDDLEWEVARLSAVSLVERSIEGTHAATAVELRRAPRSTGAIISVKRRLAEITSVAQQTEQTFQDFADLCSQVYHPIRAIRSLGLDSHPHIRSAFSNFKAHGDTTLGSTNAHHVVVRDAVYNLDLYAHTWS